MNEHEERRAKAAAGEGDAESAGTARKPAPVVHFLREIINEHNRTGKFGGRVKTRFPPEPNGYLHIGHAKSICLNFGLAREYGGACNLRFDDTNPTKEEQEYIDAIEEDVRWLGFEWAELLFASDYFEQMYAWAEKLIGKGKAYVCDCPAERVRELRGTLTEPGVPCPHRERAASESLDLFRRMRAGEFPDGARTLRARIDMASGNINMRDPVIYRILHAPHPHAGSAWCIYPMYDYAHPLEDAIEGITHSICTLEFEDHRPFYDWVIDECELPEPHPQQIEFARLNLTYTVMSKRKLLQLVQEGVVSGWDDPRMPTISGLRRRGYTPEAIRDFAERIGVAKRDSVVDVQLLEHCLREDLNRTALRRFAVLHPLKLVVENYPEGQIEEFDVPNNPEDPAAGTRKLPFSRVLWIEADDFRETPPPKYYRLYPGNEVRLRSAYLVRCTGVLKDGNGNVVEVRCTYDPATRGGSAPPGRKVQATLHWLSGAHAVPAEVRLYDRLLTHSDAGDVEEGKDWKANISPASLEVLDQCWVEPSLRDGRPGNRFQFERVGYFCVDPDSAVGKLVFNRTVTLRDTWAKIEKKQEGVVSQTDSPGSGSALPRGSV
jgi:glutaminyl-tRNA synthetase